MNWLNYCGKLPCIEVSGCKNEFWGCRIYSFLRLCLFITCILCICYCFVVSGLLDNGTDSWCQISIKLFTRYFFMLLFVVFIPSIHIIQRRRNKSVRTVDCGQQTVMHWSTVPKLRSFVLVQKTDVLSLAWVCRNPSVIIQEVTSWCVKYAQGLYRNWLKDVTTTKVDVLLLFAGGCHLCCCTCLKSGSVNVWLSQWTQDSHVLA